MKIIPIASDSMGTRSSATFVETADVKFFIDPSAALGPYRHGKGPHPMEWQRLDEHWQEIRRYAKKADAMAVSHYHYDHHNPNEPELFKGKIAFLKHPTENINKSQTTRSAFFIKQLGSMPKEIIFSDGQERKFGKTTIRFSPANFHGTNNKLGYVTQIVVEEGKEKFLYTSDIEGPAVDHQAQFILDQKPTTIYIDGPMTYMLGYRYSQQSLDASIDNIMKIIKAAKPKTIILEHHLLRDGKWKIKMDRLFKEAEKLGTEFKTAAEYAGKEVDQLEAKRTALWKEFPNMPMPKIDPRIVKNDE